MKLFLVLTALALSVTATWAAFPPKYRIVDVSPPERAFDLKLTGLNEAGDIVGSALYFADWQRHSFVYSEGQHTLMGLGDIAVAINNAGQIAGYRDTYQRRSFLAAIAGNRVDLGTLGGSISLAHGLNDEGTTVGVGNLSSADNAPFHAFSYAAGQITDIGTLPTGQNSTAMGINNFNVIVGVADTDHGTRGFIYSNAAMQELPPFPKENSLPNDYSDARAINDAGQIAGSSINAEGNLRAFLRSGSEMKDLGTLPGISKSYALSLSEDGDVVGNANELGNISNNPDFQSHSHGFLYTDGQMFDFNELVPAHDELGVLAIDDSLLTLGKLINRRGQILVVAVRPPNVRQPFLLEPLPPEAGYYTVLINPSADAEAPQTYGWASATLRKNGTIFLDGRLGNNTAFHSKGEVLADGTFQITQEPSAPDLFLAPMRFKSQRASDFSGRATWTHAVGAQDPEGSIGFTTTVAVQGMQLQTPAFAEGSWSLSFLSNSSPTLRFVTFRYSRKLGITQLSNRSAKIRFNAQTGVFQGTIFFPNEANPYSFSGVIDQTAKLGKGLYQVQSFTGALELKKLR